ncbi:MAG: MATE family efflux transporter [Actinobacteria bacterium]|nr:MAG: MATE family efflux transporter [Actinomycetota bacterium]REK37201.1 MAG: MATE family efflux transporter [Actinomycetota bacterium]
MNRDILKLAVPALGALAIDPLLTLADTAFVARLGVNELAALGVDTAILGFAFFGFNFLAYVTTPLVAQALGRDDRLGARRWVGDALTLAVGLGVLATLVLLVLAPWFVQIMGAGAEVSGPAVSYLRIRALAAPAVLVVLAGHGAFRGYHDTRTPLVVAAVVNGINLILDPLLIFTVGWGLQGAAVATVLAQWVGAAVFMRLLLAREMVARPESFASAVPSLLKLGRNGLLVTTRTAALLVAFTVAAAQATRLGPASIAAHQVVVQVWLLASMAADAFAIAGQVMVGDAVGRRDEPGIHSVTARLMTWGAGVGVLLLAAFWLGRGLLDSLAADPTVGALSVEAGGVAAVMQPIAAPLFVADGIFLGLLALGVLVASTASGSAVALVLIFATDLGHSLTGIWWALFAMVATRIAVFALAYRRSVIGALKS